MDGSTSSNSSVPAVQVHPPQQSMSNLTDERLCLEVSELQAAIQFFSRDGVSITREDIKMQLEQFFPELSVKEYNLLVNGGLRSGDKGAAGARDKEGMCLMDLMRLLNVQGHVPNSARMARVGTSRLMSQKAFRKQRYDGTGLRGVDYDEAFQLFRPVNGKIPEWMLRNVAQHTIVQGQTVRYDRAFVMRTFDQDGDGEIGKEDFKKIPGKLASL